MLYNIIYIYLYKKKVYIMYNVKRTEFADNLQFYADSASIHTHT